VGRGHQHVDGQLWPAENADLAAFDIGGGDEQFKMIAIAQGREIDLIAQHIAQGIDIERVELHRRKHAGRLFDPGLRRRRSPQVQHPFKHFALDCVQAAIETS